MKPAWVREAIQGVEIHGALEEMHRERKRTRSYSMRQTKVLSHKDYQNIWNIELAIINNVFVLMIG